MELLIAAAGIFLLYLIQIVVYRLHWDKNLGAEFRFQKQPVREGEPVRIYEKFTNGKRLPLPYFYVMFDLSSNGRLFFGEEPDKGKMKRTWFLSEVLSLRSQECKERTITVQGLKRGCYRIPEIRITTANLFLTDRFSLENETAPVSESSLYVYPAELQDSDLTSLFELLSDMFLSERNSYEDDFEIRGIREYQSFDPMKRVNWKASARQGQLQVNMMEYVASQKVMLLPVFAEIDGKEAAQAETAKHPDSGNASTVGQTVSASRQTVDVRVESGGRPTALWERAISETAAAAEYCISQGIPTGVLSNGEDSETGENLFIPPRGGRAGSEEILQGLSRIWFPRKFADMEALLLAELEEQQECCTYVILAACEDELTDRLEGLCALFGRQCVIWRTRRPQSDSAERSEQFYEPVQPERSDRGEQAGTWMQAEKGGGEA